MADNAGGMQKDWLTKGILDLLKNQLCVGRNCILAPCSQKQQLFLSTLPDCSLYWQKAVIYFFDLSATNLPEITVCLESAKGPWATKHTETAKWLILQN